jgi:hypothetical protein
VVCVLRDLFELLGAAGLFAAAIYALRGRREDATRFSLVAGLGTVYLGIDELLDLHERLGRVLYEDLRWPEPPIVNHYDDLLVILVALAGLAVIARFHAEIRRERSFGVLFLAGLALFAAAIAWDSRADPSRTGSWWTEESLELTGALTMVVAFRARLRAGSGAQAADPGPGEGLLRAPLEGEP